MRQAGRSLGGYMTVEATLIMSMVLMIYLFLMQGFLWIYDRCVLEQDVASLALKAANSHEQELEAVWQEAVSALDTDKYLWMTPDEPTMRKKGWELTVTGRGEVPSRETAVQYRLRILEPAEWLRMKRRGEQLLQAEDGEGKE